MAANCHKIKENVSWNGPLIKWFKNSSDTHQRLLGDYLYSSLTFSSNYLLLLHRKSFFHKALHPFLKYSDKPLLIRIREDLSC